jgi:hypothetical protein
LGLASGPKKERGGGSRFGLVRFVGGGYVDLNTGRFYTDQEIRRMFASLSRAEKDELVRAFVESLQNKTGERSSDRQAKRDDMSHTKGTDVSERVSNSAVYDWAESFGQRAEEKLAYAERLQASLRQDPLNYYAQQKYKEALASGKSEGEAVRYAIGEVAKLRSNPSALENWLKEFAEGQGVRGPKVNEKKLEGIQSEVPDPKKVQEQGKQLQEEVGQKIGAARNEISQGLAEISLFNPRQAKLFKLNKPTLNLRFNPNDPQLQAYEGAAQRWYKNQPGVYQRAFIDLTNTVADAKKKLEETIKKLGINIPKVENNRDLSKIEPRALK